MKTDTNEIFMQILSNVKWNESEMARRLKRNERIILLSISLSIALTTYMHRNEETSSQTLICRLGMLNRLNLNCANT